MANGVDPTVAGWTVLEFIFKGNTDTWCIGLLETLWNVVEALIDTRFRASLQLHNVLHGFLYGRGIGTSIVNLKLAQELSSVDHDPLLLVFLDLRKAYDTVETDCLN